MNVYPDNQTAMLDVKHGFVLSGLRARQPLRVAVFRFGAALTRVTEEWAESGGHEAPDTSGRRD